MNTIRYKEIMALIASDRSRTEFAEFGKGVNEEWIDKAESALGFKLPTSYKWWLRNYGGGEINGEEVYSIYEQDFDTVVGGDLVYMHRLNQSSGLLGPKQIAICHSDIDGVFFFDLTESPKDAEYPVVSAATGHTYAIDFLDFLRKRIEQAQ